MKRPQPIEKYSHIESCPHESFNAGHLHICESGCHKPQLYIEGWNAAQKHRDVEDADKRKLEQAEPKAEGDGLEDAKAFIKRTQPKLYEVAEENDGLNALAGVARDYARQQRRDFVEQVDYSNHENCNACAFNQRWIEALKKK